MNDGIRFSGSGADKFYTHGEKLEIAIRFTEPVNIPRAQLLISTGCCLNGNKPRAVIKEGNGTDQIVFG